MRTETIQILFHLIDFANFHHHCLAPCVLRASSTAIRVPFQVIFCDAFRGFAKSIYFMFITEIPIRNLGPSIFFAMVSEIGSLWDDQLTRLTHPILVLGLPVHLQAGVCHNVALFAAAYLIRGSSIISMGPFTICNPWRRPVEYSYASHRGVC